MILVTLPIRTVSEANRAGRVHWAIKARRAKAQRTAAGLLCRVQFGDVRGRLAGVPWTVTLTRIAPRALDSDNLASALKSVRDGVADALGIDDRDPRVAWAYAQRRGEPRVQAVEVRIEQLAP